MTIDAAAVGTTLTKYAVKADKLQAVISDVAADTGELSNTQKGYKVVVEPEKSAGDYDKGTALDLMVYTDTTVTDVGLLKVTVKDASGNEIGTANVKAGQTSKASGTPIHTTINGDVDCSAMSVEVEVVNFLKATGVELVNDTLHTYRVTFDRALVGSVDTSKFAAKKDASTTTTVSSAEKEGTSVLLLSLIHI